MSEIADFILLILSAWGLIGGLFLKNRLNRLNIRHTQHPDDFVHARRLYLSEVLGI
jgi:hypothetical protein